MKKVISMFGLVLNLVIFSGAQAAPPGGYIGFSLGSADDDVLNESETGYKIFGGYTVNNNFGLEVAFVDLGEYTVVSGLLEQYGFAFDAVGYLPVADNFNLMGKIGLFAWNVDIDSINATDDGTDMTYGLGVQYDLNNRISIRGEWEQFSDVSGGDVSLLSAGILYMF